MMVFARAAISALLLLVPVLKASASDMAAELPKVAPEAVLSQCTTLAGTGVQSNVRGAVSTNRLVVLTTTEIAVYNKTTCAQLSRRTLTAFFNAVVTNDQIPPGLRIRETKILYDRASQRFFIFAMATQDGWSNLWYFFASGSGDQWSGHVGELYFETNVNRYDFVGFGFTSRWMAATFDETPLVGGPTKTMIVVSPKYVGLGGSFYTDFINRVDVAQLQPSISLDGDDDIYFLSAGRKGGNAVKRVSWLYQQNIVIDSIPVQAWTMPPDAVQPNGQKIDTGDGRFSTPGVKMGNDLWQVHTVNVGGQARWRLYKLSTTGTSPTMTFTPSTTAGVHHNFNASIATAKITAGAPVFVAFSRVRPNSSTGFVESMMARGPNNSTSGWTSQTIAVSNAAYAWIAPGASCNNSSLRACRWSATSSTVIDPSSVNSAWGFNQLITGPTERNWVTHAGRVN